VLCRCEVGCQHAVMATVQLAHTAQLEKGVLAAARELLYEVFVDDMAEHDWEHCLGGMHALVWEGDELIGHGAVLLRRMLCAGQVLRAGYVEGVAVRTDHQRHGRGSALMAVLEEVIAGAYQLGVLGASERGVPFYESRGWQRWLGRTSVLTPTGVRRTPAEDGYIFVLPVDVRLDHRAELTCDWRPGDVW